MTLRRVLAAGVLIVAVAAGCSTPRPAVSDTPSPTATSLPPTPTAVVSAATGGLTPVALFLQVTAPGNETVVRQGSVEVRGTTTTDAVVSVNGQAVAVGPDGAFTSAVSLEEGPNTIEVLASDFRGASEAKVISVIFAR